MHTRRYAPHIRDASLDCHSVTARYKFTYIFQLMRISQDEMCRSGAFNWPLEHVRARHLFLERSAFYDRPNKRAIAKIANPKLRHIVDLPLRAYLRACTGDVLRPDDYDTFCDYLRRENLDGELLGHRIGHALEKQIIGAIRQDKYDKALSESA